MQESNRFVIVLKEIWPTINRGLTNLFYFLFGIIKNGIKIAIQQLKGGGLE
jgi:hypothetical protein